MSTAPHTRVRADRAEGYGAAPRRVPPEPAGYSCSAEGASASSVVREV